MLVNIKITRNSNLKEKGIKINLKLAIMTYISKAKPKFSREITNEGNLHYKIQVV